MTSRGEHTWDSGGGGCPRSIGPSGLTDDFVSCVNDAFTDDKANITDMRDSGILAPRCYSINSSISFWVGVGVGVVVSGLAGRGRKRSRS